MQTNDAAAAELRGVVKRFGTTTALDGVDLGLRRYVADDGFVRSHRQS